MTEESVESLNTALAHDLEKRGFEIHAMVKREQISDNGLSPSSVELYDLMYVFDCRALHNVWDPDWAFCPVCSCRPDEDGYFLHAILPH